MPNPFKTGIWGKSGSAGEMEDFVDKWFVLISRNQHFADRVLQPSETHPAPNVRRSAPGLNLQSGDWGRSPVYGHDLPNETLPNPGVRGGLIDAPDLDAETGASARLQVLSRKRFSARSGIVAQRR